jgi:RNA polymerase sigma factor (sigma-70 family)
MGQVKTCAHLTDAKASADADGFVSAQPFRPHSDHWANPSLAQRLCVGDERVVTEILATYRWALEQRLKWEYRSCLSADEIEEIVSTAVGHAWDQRDKFDSAKGSLGAWLLRIARNGAADVAKSPWCRQRHHETTNSPNALAEFADPRRNGLDPDQGSHAEIEFKASLQIREAMTLLSERERYILWADARSPDGSVSSGQLGEELHIAPSTVRSLRARGKLKLRETMARLGYPRVRRWGGH